MSDAAAVPLADSAAEPTPEVNTEKGEPTVRAAGGIIWRRGHVGLDVVLVHRPAYDDWSLPKGKLDPGETHELAALREVLEETSVTCRLGPELPSTRYVDSKGRDKVVRYWAMTIASGRLSGANEVDGVEWQPIEAAEGRLSYPRDVPVIRALPAVLGQQAESPEEA